MSAANRISRSIEKLSGNMKQTVNPQSISFNEFLLKVADDPYRCMRSVFQLFHDMIHHYIPHGYNEYPNDPESINYIKYDTSKLFVEDSENPFFADRLLANRLIKVADSLKEGVVRNKMLLFVGPPGSGKSTFLNNILKRMEDYTDGHDGAVYETIWRLDLEKLGIPFLPNVLTETKVSEVVSNDGTNLERHDETFYRSKDKYLYIPCPNHDHPIVQIPKQYRKQLIDDVIDDREFKRILFSHKEFEWILNNSPCPVCSSIYKALSEKLSPDEILSMMNVRHYEFSRKLGEGVSVYNPGDRVWKTPLHNAELQKWINAIFKTSDAVSYTYSRLAKTNNGIFAIMDVKMNNVERIKNIHGVISDGIHKVGTFEESINSLFLTLINPEDLDVITKEKSFRDRVIRIPIPYVRDYTTEVEIYKNTFGGGIEEYFLPRILTCFAKTIVASRLAKESKAIKEWIKTPKQYEKFCDKNMLLLKMEIYTGFITVWLTEEDVKKLDRKVRRQIIMIEGEDEGNKGFSGRDSLEMFNNFYLHYRNRDDLINMENLIEFFKDSQYLSKIPDDFLDALESLYDFTVLQEVKEAMFYYNRDQIAHDIQNYLFAINHESGTEIECPYTKDKIHINEQFFTMIENRLLNKKTTRSEREAFRNDVLKHYVARTLHEVNSGKRLTTTDQYSRLVKRYNQSLKENVLSPFIENENFRRAIKDYGTVSFKNYDKRIKDEVSLLMKNLKFKFYYTEKGAKQVCIYVIDKNLVKEFSA